MHLAQKVDNQSWIQEVQHLPLVLKIYIIAIIGNPNENLRNELNFRHTR